MSTRRPMVSTAALAGLFAVLVLVTLPAPAGAQDDLVEAQPADAPADVPAAATQTAPADAPAQGADDLMPKVAPNVEAAAKDVLGGGVDADNQPATAPVEGQDTQAQAKLTQQRLASAWADFLHYIRIGQQDAAQSQGKAILESGADPKAVYRLSLEASDTTRVLRRGEQLPGLKNVINNVNKLIEEGYIRLRTDPAEIRKSIELLPQSVEAYRVGASRLVRSGEFALPQIIFMLKQPKDKLPPLMKERLITVLPRIGKDAVLPLTEVLNSDDPELRKIVVDALRRIQYPHAGPALRELYQEKSLLPSLRDDVGQALLSCCGPEAARKPVAEMYYDLAEKFYSRAESLQPDPRASMANVWYWTNDLGLTYKPVPRQIYCDVYAMRMSRLALAHDGNYYPAVPLWLSAYLTREQNLPAGSKDPLLAETTLPAAFYLQAASARYQQAVLARALDKFNTPSVLAAIEALARTNGAQNMVKVHQGTQPLVAAMNYPDRHVRFRAAEALALALPTSGFNGSDMVIPVLNEALRTTGTKRAMIVAADQAALNKLKAAVRAAGYQLMEESDPAKALAAVRVAGGVDVVIATTNPPAESVRMLMRREARFQAVPMIAAVAVTEGRRALAKRDGRLLLIGHEPTDDAVGEALKEAMTLAAGAPLTPEQAQQWSVRAARALRLLAQTQNKILEYPRSQEALLEALAGEPPVATAAAHALAVYPTAEAQRGIVELAVSDADPAVRVSAYGSATESVRRSGNQITEPQAAKVVAVVVDKQASAALREAAANLLGALDLPSEKIKALMLSTDELD